MTSWTSQGKTVVVVGLALTGIAVAKFCARRGARVIVTDGKPADKLAEQIALLDGVPVTLAARRPRRRRRSRPPICVVMSPGVPTLPEMTRRARRRRRGDRRDRARVSLPRIRARQLIAITGTNGKSTTTALTGALCAASGRPTFCGGNLGNMPLIDAVDHPANVAGRPDRRRGRGVHARELHDVSRAGRRADEHHRGSPRSLRHDGALRRDEGPDLGLPAPRRHRDRATPPTVGDARDRRHPVAALHVRLAAERDRRTRRVSVARPQADHRAAAAADRASAIPSTIS